MTIGMSNLEPGASMKTLRDMNFEEEKGAEHEHCNEAR